jgi:hypothetical protein
MRETLAGWAVFARQRIKRLAAGRQKMQSVYSPGKGRLLGQIGGEGGDP